MTVKSYQMSMSALPDMRDYNITGRERERERETSQPLTVLQRLYYDGFTHSLVSGGKNDDTIVEILHQRPAHAAVAIAYQLVSILQKLHVNGLCASCIAMCNLPADLTACIANRIVTSLVPRLLWEGEERAWYTPFAHALN